jgi:hypothetical protein
MMLRHQLMLQVGDDGFLEVASLVCYPAIGHPIKLNQYKRARTLNDHPQSWFLISTDTSRHHFLITRRYPSIMAKYPSAAAR